MTKFTVEKAHSANFDVQRLLKIFGLEHRQVFEISLIGKSASLLELHVKCEVSQDEMTAMLEEFKKDPPTNQQFFELKYTPTGE